MKVQLKCLFIIGLVLISLNGFSGTEAGVCEYCNGETKYNTNLLPEISNLGAEPCTFKSIQIGENQAVIFYNKEGEPIFYPELEIINPKINYFSDQYSKIMFGYFDVQVQMTKASKEKFKRLKESIKNLKDPFHVKDFGVDFYNGNHWDINSKINNVITPLSSNRFSVKINESTAHFVWAMLRDDKKYQGRIALEAAINPSLEVSGSCSNQIASAKRINKTSIENLLPIVIVNSAPIQTQSDQSISEIYTEVKHIQTAYTKSDFEQYVKFFEKSYQLNSNSNESERAKVRLQALSFIFDHTSSEFLQLLEELNIPKQEVKNLISDHYNIDVMPILHGDPLAYMFDHLFFYYRGQKNDQCNKLSKGGLPSYENSDDFDFLAMDLCHDQIKKLDEDYKKAFQKFKNSIKKQDVFVLVTSSGQDRSMEVTLSEPK
ncbi:MAG TPA: hypothetical protein PLJ21_08555 [Pseudobdellovibrionaceae bacterium]|nr:hypothetical protein [Pseudobdellovibrionaceae bacterium]